jgi:hypothetical protein
VLQCLFRVNAVTLLLAGSRSVLWPKQSALGREFEMLGSTVQLKAAERAHTQVLAIPLPGAESHLFVMSVIVNELAERGHSVMVRPLPLCPCLVVKGFCLAHARLLFDDSSCKPLCSASITAKACCAAGHPRERPARTGAGQLHAPARAHL